MAVLTGAVEFHSRGVDGTAFTFVELDREGVVTARVGGSSVTSTTWHALEVRGGVRGGVDGGGGPAAVAWLRLDGEFMGETIQQLRSCLVSEPNDVFCMVFGHKRTDPQKFVPQGRPVHVDCGHDKLRMLSSVLSTRSILDNLTDSTNQAQEGVSCRMEPHSILRLTLLLV